MKKGKRPEHGSGARRFVFDLPPKRRGGEERREIELREVSRELHASIMIGSLTVAEGDMLTALNRTDVECQKAAIVRVGNDRVSSELSGEVLFYRLSTREKRALKFCYDKLHEPSRFELEHLYESATWHDDRGVWTFELPHEVGFEAPKDVEGNDALRVLTLRELEVHDAEQVGFDVLKDHEGIFGLGQHEKAALVARAFVSLEDPLGKTPPSLDAFSQRTYTLVEKAYAHVHAPSAVEVEAASESMRLA